MIQTSTILTPEEVLTPTATSNSTLPLRLSDFSTLTDALDYAAEGETGLNFYLGRGELDTSLPYKVLREEAIRIAKTYIKIGLKPGDRVGIVADMNADFVISFFACQYAGMLAVPLPVITGLGGRQGYENNLRRVITTAKTRVILGNELLMESLRKASEGLDILFLGDLSDLDQSHGSEDLKLSPLGPNDPSHIQYSSGSTRNPLGVIISQKALMANAKSVAQDGLKFRKNDRTASWLPFYHDMGLIGFLLIPMTSQLSIDYYHTDNFARRPLKWLEIISNNRCTMAFSPTFGYEICTRRSQKMKEMDLDLSCWRVAGIGGEMVQPETMQNFFEAFAEYGFKEKAFVPSYGLAEATLAFSFSPLDTGVITDTVDMDAMVNDNTAISSPPSDNSRTFAACGPAMPGYDVEVRDDNDTILENRQIGEVFIKGPSLMDSYFENQEATDAAFDENGWLNTGDMGYLFENTLVITGRRKDMIIVNGRNIWPQDLEWHAEEEIQLLRTRDTAAFSVEGDDKKEGAIILAQCRSSDEKVQNDMRHDIHACLFRNTGINCKVVLISPGSLPYTTSGKLSRARAKKYYLDGTISVIGD